MKTERKFTYLKQSETKDEQVFNGDDPKENKAFFDALKADEKDRIERSPLDARSPRGYISGKSPVESLLIVTGTCQKFLV